MSIKEQNVIDKKGNPVAVQIPVEQYKKLLKLAEEMEDIRAFDKAMKRNPKFVSLKEAVAQIKKQRKS